jgi:hypothetical protein
MNIKLPCSYFDKKTPEEDIPVNVDSEIQQKFQQIDELYEKFFLESTLSFAKVNNN